METLANEKCMEGVFLNEEVISTVMSPVIQISFSCSTISPKYDSQDLPGMASRDVAVGVIVLSQTVLGILGNFSLLYHDAIVHFRGCRLKPPDLILRHLIVANTLTLLSRGIPHTSAVFGRKHLPSDIGCKVVFYVHRVARGMSFGAMCLLSILQAITISPRSFIWTDLKAKAPRYTGLSIYLCWTSHLLVNTVVVTYVTGKWSRVNITREKDLGYCSSTLLDKSTSTLFAVFLSPPSTLSFGLMVLASGYMVFILYRHNQQVRHMHRTSHPTRSSPECRASQKILALMSTFLSFYCLTAVLVTYQVTCRDPSWWLMNVTGLLHSCFPALSPFLLMSPDTSVARLCLACCRRTTQVPHRVRKP
uniref:Vomeronasal type-1 receptor n=1 Tax=Sus scrofa TaxID=9823 RepID=A0A8D1X8W7_PIG